MIIVIAIVIILFIDIILSLISESIHIDMSEKEKANSVESIVNRITYKKDFRPQVIYCLVAIIIQIIIFYWYIFIFKDKSLHLSLTAYMFIFSYSIISRIYIKQKIHYLIDKKVAVKTKKQKAYYVVKFVILTSLCFIATFTTMKILIHQFINN